MFDKTLKSGRKVKIKELTIDQIDDINDISFLCFIGEGLDVARTIKYESKATTAWIRCGLVGGDFDNWKPNGVAPPDHVLKQLTKLERAELVSLIQECQIINPKKPSNSD
tara:strand:+ start:255 stop:584 length:330 start_codon:yes stop_codon:yes gene_type:complete